MAPPEISLSKGMAAEKGNPFRADEVSTDQGQPQVE